MKREKNHKIQGMWMLLLPTADSSKRREVKHTSISRLNCRNYPLDYKECGGTKFVKRHFKEGEFIRLEDVKAKLVNMGPHRDRLKMVVIFFLALDDLDFCRTFPWGRYTYDYMLKEISHTIDHFGGLVKEKIL
ncbi:hypothetical protein BRARA_D00716 [Brassica rapa]|uniref:DUF1985 domain-containing protein n=1 Tax=Brassica campestris TaxID=3711 RepID=A0A397ZIR2_BRACM|nr:hypothetical protein BRARA_D00716 [Brassica rapa]